VGTSFGTENSDHGWQNDSLADVAIIKIWSGHWPANKNKFLADPESQTSAAITSYKTFSQQVEGTQVCRIGWGSWEYPPSSYYKARKCGKIILEDSDAGSITDDNSQSCATIGGETRCRYIKSMKVVNFDSTGGDSGGIVFVPNNPVSAATQLLGTHVHSKDDDSGVLKSWYSTTTKGFSELQSKVPPIYIRPCQSSGC
jgi:hypothetical protein